MTILGKDKIRHIARVLQYAPIAIAFFFAVSFWRKGFTEGAIAFGLMGIGFLLLIVLLHITEKIIGNKRRFVLVCSILVIAIGVYSLIDEDIYAGIGITSIGMTLIFSELVRGKWKHICCGVVIGLAVGAFILEEVNDDKPHAIEREVGVHQEVTGRSYFHA